MLDLLDLLFALFDVVMGMVEIAGWVISFVEIVSKVASWFRGWHRK